MVGPKIFFVKSHLCSRFDLEEIFYHKLYNLNKSFLQMRENKLIVFGQYEDVQKPNKETPGNINCPLLQNCQGLFK